MYVPDGSTCANISASSTITTSSSIGTITINTIKATSRDTIIDINFNWVGVNKSRPNGVEKQILRAPWPENMANLLHGFLEKNHHLSKILAKKCEK